MDTLNNIYTDPITGLEVRESDIKCEICNKQINRCSINHRLYRKQSLIDHLRCYEHKKTILVSINYKNKIYTGGVYSVASELHNEGLKCEKCNNILTVSSIAHRIQRNYDFQKPMLCNSCNWNSNNHRLYRVYKLTLNKVEADRTGYFYFADTTKSGLFKFGVTTSVEHREKAFYDDCTNYIIIYESSWGKLCRLEYEIKKKFTSEETFNLYGSNEILPNKYKNKIKEYIKNFDFSKLKET